MQTTVHKIKLDDYIPTPSSLTLGTTGSKKTEELILIPGHGWEGATIEVTFSTPSGHVSPVIAALDNVITVPASAMAEYADGYKEPGYITFRAIGEDGQERISTSIKYRVMCHGAVGGEIEPEPDVGILDQILASEYQRQENEIAREQRVDEAIKDLRSRAETGEFDGAAGTITIQSVVTGEPGTDATVENIGTDTEAVLIITIPRGEDGKVDYDKVNQLIEQYITEHQIQYDDTELREAIRQLSSDLQSKVNTSDVYNKTEIDQKLEDAGKVKSVNGMTGDVILDIPDAYDDTEIHQEIGNKADKSELNDFYKKSEVDEIVGGVTELIPEQASADNQLADKNYVDTSVATNTAYYISKNGEPFSSVEELKAYSGAITNNDYAFVIGTDDSGNVIYTRYKYNALTQEWAEEFVLNNSSFTSEQWSAISSGITALFVQEFSRHIADKNNPHAVTYQQLGGTKPTYTASEVGALPADTEIPPDLSEDVDWLKEEVSDVVHVDPDGSPDPEDAVEVVTADEFDKEVARLDAALNGKQESIPDLQTIRDGANKGATALQEVANIKADLGGCKFSVVDGILTVTYDDGSDT